jgi:hypothetical protein
MLLSIRTRCHATKNGPRHEDGGHSLCHLWNTELLARLGGFPPQVAFPLSLFGKDSPEGLGLTARLQSGLRQQATEQQGHSEP